MAIGAALAAGGAALIGGLFGNRAKRKESERDRSFQERMSSTSWQRGVKDMEAAGLNPALAYRSGGASSPSGAMAQQDDVVSPAVSSAMAAKRLKADLKLIEQQENTLYNDARLKSNQARESATRNELIMRQQTHQDLMNTVLELQLPWARAQSGAATKYGSGAAMMQLLLQSGGSQAAGLAGGGLAASFLRRNTARRGR